jgi:quercetin dioxygenase-like cupin family protein
MKKLLILAAVIAVVGSASAQMSWRWRWSSLRKDNPALPKGAQSVTLLGDPTKAGEMVVTRTKLPANDRVPAHTHPMAETVTVISGSVGFGMGEKFDDKKGEMVKTGGFFAQPAKHAHYVWTGNEEAVIQVQYVGPGGINYVNPEDDPRKK